MPHTDHSQAFEQAKNAFLSGLAHLEAGRLAEAEAAFEGSLALLPGRVSTLVNLAAVRNALGKPAAALEAAQAVLKAEPANEDALLHQANALRALGRHAEAVTAYDAALAQHPDWAEGWLCRGISLLETHRPAEALQSLERAVALDAKLVAAWTCRGDILRDMGRLDDARRAYEQALAAGADPQLIGYCLAGLGQGAAPPTAPRAYVQALFDGYAGDFDQHLTQVLRYRVPEALAAPLAQVHPQPFRCALDLGCGTGLCGPRVRPLVQRLVGLDLSEKILAQARARGVYDELLQGEIVQHLEQTRETHDLVLAADVFIYVGDLAPVFAALERVVPPGGVFCFSAETEGADEAAGYALRPSLRYAHHETYLRRLAARHGFEPLSVSHETVREEQRRPIPGLIVHLRRR